MRPVVVGSYLGVNLPEIQDGQATGKRIMYHVHKLVLLTFVGPVPPGHIAVHLDRRDPWNNHLTNLQYRDRREDQREVPHRRILDWAAVHYLRDRFAAGDITVSALARELGVAHSTVSAVIAAKTWKAHGATPQTVKRGRPRSFSRK